MRPAEAPASRILIIVRSLASHLRFLDEAITELLLRGHSVELITYKVRERPEERAWVEELTQREPGFSASFANPRRGDPWYALSRTLRSAVDYLELLVSDLGGREALVVRNARRAPRWALAGYRWTRPIGLARPFTAAVRALDRAVPASPWFAARLREDRPDLVIVAPAFLVGSVDSRFVRAAREAGVPCCVAVATWDALGCKQRIAAVPDRTLVWNRALAEEAVSRHGIPRESITITGAHCFDRWFDHEPLPRGEWCDRLGIDPQRPYVLYVGGSLGRRTLAEAGATEAQWVRRWVAALRAAPDRALRSATIVIRPHPKIREDAKVAREWAAVTFDDLEGVVLWPRDGTPMPISQEARSDYFQSLHHSHAVVGLNSSAMVEAAIVGRPVFSVEAPEFASSQHGVPHFAYLTDPECGLLYRSPNLDAHVEGLAEALHRSPDDPRSRAFVEWFVRPGGINTPAASVFADAVEDAAAARPEARQGEGAARRLVLFPLAVLRRLTPTRRHSLRRRRTAVVVSSSADADRGA